MSGRFMLELGSRRLRAFLRRGPAWAAVLTAGILASSCRPGEGERCYCYDECRGGLACAAAGSFLRPGQCIGDLPQGVSSIDAGVCIEGSGETLGDGGIDPPPFWDLRFDLPKTDFAPPRPLSEEDETEGGPARDRDETSTGIDSSSTEFDPGSTGTTRADDGLETTTE